ncbi:MAG: glycosyltransferase [Acidimicrobiia bacterium]|nr:glycosyltransferase [Acidimicrobiia bacterium]
MLNKARNALEQNRPLVLSALILFTLGMVWLVVVTVDRESLVATWAAIADDPPRIALVLGCFASAFALRAIAWRGLVPGLSFSQAFGALHVSLGGNHILPLRLGEPLRILSVVRRTSVAASTATASTLTLRAADIVSLVILGFVAGLGRFVDTWVLGPLLIVGIAVVGFGVWWLRRLPGTRRPGPMTLILTFGAWGLESVVVWQVALLGGLAISFMEAILVTAAAVVAQIVAIAPGGFGTYEAGGVAALAFLGHPLEVALAIVLTAHAIKTAYSLVTGLIGALVPEPGLFGRFRIPPQTAPTAGDEPPQDPGPVVFFLPAHNEGGRVGPVVHRIPEQVEGHRVVKMVIDDGSTDDTAAEASEAGADVVSLSPNRGLGGAVRVGMAKALEHDPAAVVFCDADGEYAPEELVRLVTPILTGSADYVVGSRFGGEIDRMLPHRRLGNRVLTFLLSWVARRRVGDGQSGYRAFSSQAAAAAEIAHDYNYAQVITLDLLQKGFRYREVPISYTFRSGGDSFVRLGRYLRAVLPAVWREINDRVPPTASVASVLDDMGGEGTSGLRPNPVVDAT